jgi:PTH2 family peptidyl-tRNA hydrolase
MESKQVLVMKKFPKDRNLRTGKYVAQGSHAAVGALFSQGQIDGDYFKIPLKDPFVREWVTGRFKKISVYVENDQELVEIYNAARKAGLFASLIKDAGLTEFNGVPTLTAVGIGPGNPEEIDKITGHLPLF